METLLGILIPFVGTAVGAAGVFFMRKTLAESVRRALIGFAAGVMVAASVWSLLLPAIEQSATMNKWSFVPAFVGLWLGVLFFLTIDRITPYIQNCRSATSSAKNKTFNVTMTVLAVTIHNIPEGMAVGIAYAAVLSEINGITSAAALALSVGIAIQNFPEGAIVSMPLKSEGMSKPKAFAVGVLSGAVEPVAATLTILCSSLIAPLLPYLLSFAAGAMLYVVVKELIAEISDDATSNIGTIFFFVGFSLMMSLDVALG